MVEHQATTPEGSRKYVQAMKHVRDLLKGKRYHLKKSFVSFRALTLLSMSFMSISLVAQGDFRYRVMESANIDIYPNDDDVAVIAKYLTAMGVQKSDVPSDIADSITSQIGHLGAEAEPRLLSAYMYFLRHNVNAPPFDGGGTNSTRMRILLAIEDDLKRRSTPACELALLMFRETNDAGLRQIADSADYDALRSFPWLVGREDWMNWILSGLNQAPSARGSTAAQLTNVRSFIASLDIRPPVSESSINFWDYADHPGGWGEIKGGPTVPHLSDETLFSQQNALAHLLSHRFAATLGVTPVSDQFVDSLTRSAFQVSPGLPYLAGIYKSGLGITSSRRDRFDQLYETFLSQQRRLLALATYALVVYQKTHQCGAVDIGMDKVFKTLTDTTLSTSEKKTIVTLTITPNDLRNVAANGLEALSKCDPRSYSVAKRLVSLRSRSYLETINAHCTDETDIRVVRSGYLSTDFIEMLKLNPNYLDIIGLSLGQRDLYLSNSASDKNPQDVDLIRANAKLSGALMLAVLEHPHTPWQYVRDALLQDWPISIEWFSPGWRPSSVGFEQPAAVVLNSPAEFTKTKEALFAGQVNLFQHEARHRFLSGIAATIDSLPATVRGCRAVSNCSQDGTGQTNCTPGTECSTYPSGKRGIVEQYNQIVREADKYVDKSSSLFDEPCRSETDHYTDSIRVAISQGTDDFIVGYSHGTCFAATQGSLKSYPGDISKAIGVTLKQDPRFFNRHQLDLLDSSDNWQARFVAALVHSSQEEGEATSSLQVLKATDLLYYLPSIGPPLSTNSGGFFRQWPLPLHYNSPLNAMIAPLLGTPTGMDLANDLAAVQYLAGVLPPPLVSENQPEISDSFIQKLREQEQQAISDIDREVDKQVEGVKAQLDLQRPPPAFSVGFSFTLGPGGAPVPGLYFSYGSAGFSATLQSSAAIITPTIEPFHFPGLPFVIPGSLALSPFLPALTIPLRHSAGAGSAAVQMDNYGGANPAAAQSPILETAASRDAHIQNLTADQTGNDQPNSTLSITFNTHASIANVNWNTLLASSNFIGRMWIRSELTVAQPLLTASELASIREGLLQPVFPASLAKLIALRASQASSLSPNSVVIVSFSQVLEAACTKSTWSNCGVAVKQSLDKKPSDPRDVLNLALLWAAAYDSRYDELRKQGHLDKSTPDSEKISEEVKSHIDPLEIAKDKIEDKVLKLLLGKLAFLMDAVGSPWILAIKVSLDSSEVASDFDELELMNRSMQKEITKQLTPFVIQGWRDRLDHAVERNNMIIKP